VQAFLESYALEVRAPRETHLSLEMRRARMQYFLKVLGDPQEAFKAIHVAGTTGKGSTCSYIEAILRQHGFKTGLSLSPHVSDIRERFQIGGRLIEEERFVRLIQGVLPAVRQLEQEPQGPPAYMQLLRGISYLLFAQEGVDYAVIETGIGGRFDSSNSIQRTDKFCVITKLGFDHMNSLGDTIEAIALQKVGIIHPGNEVVLAVQEEISRDVLQKMAESAGAKRVWCVPETPSSRFAVSSVPYLQQNAETAQFVCQHLARRDGWKEEAVVTEKSLRETELPLRFERYLWKGKTFIFDGAHNPQKMQGLAQALRCAFPTESLALAVAFNPGTDIPKTLAPLYPIAQRFACVDFIGGQGDYRFRFIDPTSVAVVLQEAPSEKIVQILPEWELFLEWVEKTPEQVIVVTGSFHFVASVSEKLFEEANRG
jgi:dihydrofolate synthase/folylpolyglutamate synthase